MLQKINYQKELDRLITDLQKEEKVPTLLLHSCCAPCSSYVLEYLSNYFRITVLYYNPNIYPESEYSKRIIEQQTLIGAMHTKYPVQFIAGSYEKEKFYAMAKGLEEVKEGGVRCFKCYELRLREAAEIAKAGGYEYFTTTLSISPLKNAAKLNEIGLKLAEEASTRKYVPVPLNEFCKNRIRKLEESGKWLQEHMPTEKAYVEGYITIEGAENILNKIKNLLSQVDQRVYISCTRNYLLLLIRELDTLMEERKKVVIITDQPATFHNAKVYFGENRGMQIGIIADSKYVLTGEYGEGSMNTCLYSGQKNFVDLYKTALANEIKLLSIREENKD